MIKLLLHWEYCHENNASLITPISLHARPSYRRR